MNPKVGFFGSLVLGALSWIIPLTIAAVSVADGNHARHVAMHNHETTQGLLRTERKLDVPVAAGVTFDQDQANVMYMIGSSAAQDVPSVKIAEAIIPSVPMAGFVLFFLGLCVFGHDKLFTISDKACKEMIAKARKR